MMTKLCKSQKKGKKSIYNSRFLKKKETTDTYLKMGNELSSYRIIELKKSTKSSSIVAVVQNINTFKKFLYPAPESVKVGALLNQEDGIVLKNLKDYKLGQKVCAIEIYQNQNKFICSAAGTFATIYSQNAERKETILLVKKRKIKLCWDNKAMAGVMSNSNFNLKPMTTAGTASRISYSKGKKYPNVSEHKKNALDSCIGGSYRKSKRIKCVRHDSHPKQKTGHISPSRNGKKKKN